MRVTGGAWRGRKLLSPADSDVRPTTDRVREALFSILGDLVRGFTVADLCCGSGALGLEALSRGAAHATFVDVSPAALRIVRANLERCGCGLDRYALRRIDAVTWFAGRLRAHEGPLMVFADPPYESDVGSRLLAILPGNADPPSVPVVVVEHAPGRAPAIPVDLVWQSEVRRYGSSSLTILRRPATLEANPDPETEA